MALTSRRFQGSSGFPNPLPFGSQHWFKGTSTGPGKENPWLFAPQNYGLPVYTDVPSNPFWDMSGETGEKAPGENTQIPPVRRPAALPRGPAQCCLSSHWVRTARPCVNSIRAEISAPFETSQLDIARGRPQKEVHPSTHFGWFLDTSRKYIFWVFVQQPFDLCWSLLKWFLNVLPFQWGPGRIHFLSFSLTVC